VYSCSDFSGLTVSNRECITTAGTTNCSVQINTRLEVSPVNQESCFHITDSNSRLLGSISIKTKSLTLRCMKEELYFAPQPVVRCFSHNVCYNLYASSDCHGNKCIKFGANDTIKAFKEYMDTYGYSLCETISNNHCWLLATKDCSYGRVSFTNPSGLAYPVFRCPEWRYAVTLEVTTHLGKQKMTNTTTLYPGKTTLIEGIKFSLISATLPVTPVLNDCILQHGRQYSVVPCNDRDEYVSNRLGELKCPTMASARKLSPACMGSVQLVRTEVDSFSIKCFSQLIDPQKLLNNNKLPMQLSGGIMLPHDDTIVYESSINSILEIQLSTSNNIHIIKEMELTRCQAEFVKLEGTYASITGASLTIKAKSDSSNCLATFECLNSSIHSAVDLTDKWKDYQLIVKFNTPDVNVNCTLTCSNYVVPLQISGHLHYLGNLDMRLTKTDISYEPLQTNIGSFRLFPGFDLLSIFGSNMSTYLYRIIILCIVILLAYITFSYSMKMMLKKLI